MLTEYYFYYICEVKSLNCWQFNIYNLEYKFINCWNSLTFCGYYNVSEMNIWKDYSNRSLYFQNLVCTLTHIHTMQIDSHILTWFILLITFSPSYWKVILIRNINEINPNRTNRHVPFGKNWRPEVNYFFTLLPYMDCCVKDWEKSICQCSFGIHWFIDKIPAVI